MWETIEAFDNQLLLWINSYHTEFWDTFMITVSERMIWVPFYLTILATVWRCYGWRTALLMGVMAGLAIAAADQTCASLIRPHLHRLRPANLDNPISQFVHVVDGYRGGKYGFPSCHAANTFALVGLTSMLFKRREYTIGILSWAIIVCYSRMYLGVHYPGDILIGAIIGTIIGIATYLFAELAMSMFVYLFPKEEEARRIVATYKRGAPSITVRIGKYTDTTSPIMMPVLVCLLLLICIIIYAAATYFSWK